MHDFKRLSVWHKARGLTAETYRVTAGYPVEERFGLTSQMRRAAVSVMTNIAEGAGRGSAGEFARFLRIAAGSAAELESLALLSRDLGFTSDGRLVAQAVELKKMLFSLEGSARR